MKAQIWSYSGDSLVQTANVDIPDTFDHGDPYSTLGFSLGSNQEVVTDEFYFKPDLEELK